MYDLNQRTTQALNNLAIENATFEQAGANLEVETSEEGLLFADVRTAMEEFTEALQHQERMQGELKDFQVCLDNAFGELKEANRNLEDAGKRIVETNAEFREANRNKEDAGRRTTETKRKADDDHDRTRSHRDRCRRASKEL